MDLRCVCRIKTRRLGARISACASSLPGAVRLRPGLGFHGPKPVSWSHGFQGSGSSNDLLVARTRHVLRWVAYVWPRHPASACSLAWTCDVRTAEDTRRTRRDHGAGRRARRFRPIVLVVEGLHPPIRLMPEPGHPRDRTTGFDPAAAAQAEASEHPAETSPDAEIRAPRRRVLIRQTQRRSNA